MQGLKITARACAYLVSLVAVPSFLAAEATAAKMTGDPATTCSDLIRPADNAVRIDSAAIVTPAPLAVAERGRTPSPPAPPPNPEFSKALAQIAPPVPKPPPIKSQ